MMAKLVRQPVLSEPGGKINLDAGFMSCKIVCKIGKPSVTTSEQKWVRMEVATISTRLRALLGYVLFYVQSMFITKILEMYLIRKDFASFFRCQVDWSEIV